MIGNDSKRMFLENDDTETVFARFKENTNIEM